MNIEFKYACPPAEKEDQERIGLFAVQTDGTYIRATCERCRIPVLLGKEQQEQYKIKPAEIVCFECVKKDPDHMMVLAMGVGDSRQSHASYIAKRGGKTIIHNRKNN